MAEPPDAPRPENESSAAPAGETVRGFSFPLGIPLLLYPVLFWLSGRPGAVGLIALAALALCALTALWQMLSEKAFAEIHAGDPTQNRLTWRLNWLLFFVLPALLLLAWALGKRVQANP